MRTLRTGMNEKSNDRWGFTLVELSLVCVLIVVLAVMAAPAFTGFWRANQVRSCAWQIATLARRARDYAICHAVRTACQYDPVQREFRIAAESNPSDAPGQFEPLSLASARPVRVPDVVDNVDLLVEGEEAQEDWPIIFFPDGQALRGEVLLEAEPDKGLSVEIVPLTGRAKVVEGNVREGR